MPARSALKPRKRPRQERSRQTVAAILAAAAQVFQRHGYARGTTDAIARRAGVSIGSLYQYFPGKDAILVALAEDHVDAGLALAHELLADLRRTPPDAETALRRMVDAMIALHRHEPELHRVLFEEAPLPASLRRGLRQREESLADEVCALLERLPDVRVPNPKLSGYLLVQAVEGLVHSFVLHPPRGVPADAFREEVVCMLHRYLE